MWIKGEIVYRKASAARTIFFHEKVTNILSVHFFLPCNPFCLTLRSASLYLVLVLFSYIYFIKKRLIHLTCFFTVAADCSLDKREEMFSSQSIQILPDHSDKLCNKKSMFTMQRGIFLTENIINLKQILWRKRLALKALKIMFYSSTDCINELSLPWCQGS